MNAILAIKTIESIQQIANYQLPRTYRDRFNPFSLKDDEFKDKYRFRKATVKKIVDLVKQDIELDSRGCGTPVELQVMVALRCWGRREHQNNTGDFHGISQPTVSRICVRVARALCTHAKDKIKMPESHEEQAQVMKEFHDMHNFPNVIGVIESKIIKIKKTYRITPYKINRTGYDSLVVQIICDANLKIRDIETVWSNSTLNYRIFNESRIKERLENGEFEGRLLGESGYKLTPYLFTPLEEPKNVKEEQYNESHMATKRTVQRCFYLWRQRFRCLHDGLTINLSSGKSVILALAVLHNIAIEEDDLTTDGFDEDIREQDEDIEVFTQTASTKGIAKSTLKSFIQNNF